MGEKGRHLDLSSGAGLGDEPARSSVGGGGKFLGVHFKCCDVYCRVYPNRQRTAYEGRCPRCGKRVQFRVGAEGTDARFFQAF